MNQPRQCPGCKTWYAPQVEKCECEKSQSSGVTFRAGDPMNGGMGKTIMLKDTPSYTEGLVTHGTDGSGV